MEFSDKEVRRLLWEARVLFSDPRHPINDRRHPKHDQALAALRLIEDHGKRLVKERAQQNAAGC